MIKVARDTHHGIRDLGVRARAIGGRMTGRGIGGVVGSRSRDRGMRVGVAGRSRTEGYADG